MRVPAVQGMIDRRILVNYQVDPDILSRRLPAPFRPKLANGVGIAGICLIRLSAIRPQFVPSFFGISSENAAHRIAVEWDSSDGRHEGVFIPRRDTSSWVNVQLGGRLFPGVHQRARFRVQEEGDRLSVDLRSLDKKTTLSVRASVATELDSGSIFDSTKQASDFFERGSLGYSATSVPGCFDGLELKSLEWEVTPLAVEHVESSYFSDSEQFPRGSVRFDSGLLMRGIPHEWHARKQLRADVAPG